MIVVTGAAGFIGSNMVGKLNDEGCNDLLLVDDFSDSKKNLNIKNKKYTGKIEISEFLDWFSKNGEKIEFIFHIGARTDTAETDTKIFDELNLNYTKKIWEICSTYQIPLVYASSAATYGIGEHGYRDSHDVVNMLKPLNPYGVSKNDFDAWALKQKNTPPFWAGLKFFNVYGPNEYHKGRMSSVMLGAFNQIQEGGKVKLFKSHNKKYKDGEQLRDFIYVKDVVDICYFFLDSDVPSGIYNVGTGHARTFFDLVCSVFTSLGKEVQIEFIDTPSDIRDTYQYFTEADMGKLRSVGYSRSFTGLEEGVAEYVQKYLVRNEYR